MTGSSNRHGTSSRWTRLSLFALPFVLAVVMLWGAARAAVSPAATRPASDSAPAATTAVPPPQVTIVHPAATGPAPRASPAASTATVAAATVDPECTHFHASPDLLLPLVNRAAGLARDFEPADLVSPPLAYRNAYIVPIRIRQAVVAPLLDLLGAANEAGMQIVAVSGYRSYDEQAVAYERWKQLYPNRASTISAEPGHSEHQLGTSVDFSTPALQERYGEVFHTDFFRLPEGRWLYDYSPQFGFTLSYPAWAEQVTGYQWEPWHFRFVGAELAQLLAERKMTLTEYLMKCAPGD